MPISAEMRALYPADWPAVSRAVKVGAGWCCHDCGVVHQAWGWRDANGAFHTLDRLALHRAGYKRTPFLYPLPDGQAIVRVIEIVLTTAHLDHDPTHNAPANLRALCQYHHLMLDGPLHRQRAARTRRAKMRTMDLLDQVQSALP